MVAQRSTDLRMRSRVTRGKENILTLRRKQETYLRKHELGISIFRNKLQARAERYQNVEEKLDRQSRQMQVCFMQLMEMIKNTKKLITEEREETMQLLHCLDDCCFNHTEVALKTQTVPPMIYGVPLKKASISLIRLDPFREQRNHNMPRVFADSSPACDVGFTRTDASPPVVHRSMEPLQVNLVSSCSSSSSSEDEGSYSDDLRCRERRRRRCEPTNHVPSKSTEVFNLKTASIPLKRLDPRPYLPEAGNTRCPQLNSVPMEDEYDGPQSLHSAAAPEIHTENGSSTRRMERVCIGNGRGCDACLPHMRGPTVVLKRLRSVPSSGELNSHDQRTNSSTNSTTRKKRKSDKASCCTAEKAKTNGQNNSGKKTVKSNGVSSKESKKKKSGNGKKKESRLDDSSPNKEDEDPLEGPSWLYKDGVKKARLRKFKKIRQGYFTPLYYLSPTIYSSTDDSGDEMTENERKTSKHRKKKQKRRNSCS